MARKPATRAEFELFDVLYTNGTQRSNRRVPREIRRPRRRRSRPRRDRGAGPPDREKSGQPALAVKSIRRSSAR